MINTAIIPLTNREVAADWNAARGGMKFPSLSPTDSLANFFYNRRVARENHQVADRASLRRRIHRKQ